LTNLDRDIPADSIYRGRTSTMPDTRFPTPPDRMTQTDFMECFGGIYEHSPWVAAALWDEGLGPEDGELAHFAARMRGVVDAAPHERRLALLRAHPELAGKLAVADGLTAESKSEQAGAGLDRCTPAEFARFTELNARYSDSFGHPFIIAVKGLDRAAILDAFERRIGNDAETEFATAVGQVHRIALLRLESLCG
jgi:2-oxo-4-hydroxy-4-carboxy-5-ureidoimidazoline decarboxylase